MQTIRMCNKHNAKQLIRLCRERELVVQMCFECLENDYDKEELRSKIRDMLKIMLGKDEI